jgi:hypothetical protein
VLCKFPPISVYFVAVWTSEKPDFVITQIFEYPEYSLGRINSIIFISQCIWMFLIGMYFIRIIFASSHTSSMKIKSRKGFWCCRKNFTARIPHETRRRIMGRIESGHGNRLMEASRRCGLAKSNWNCDPQRTVAWEQFSAQMEFQAFNWQLTNLRH